MKNMRVNCNISAIIANNQLGKGESALSKSMERLSSGLKINHAEDDAAGMAISKKMHAQIRALEQSAKNTKDGVSVVQTAESALSEVGNMLQRMRELAVQAADDTNCEEDRAAIQLEINQLKSEIDRISNDTEYNTMYLLDGTLSRRSYADIDGVSMFSVTQNVLSGEYVFSVTAAAEQAEIALNSFTTATEAGSITINEATYHYEAGDTFDSIYKGIQDACERGTATVRMEGGNMAVTNKAYGKQEELIISFSDENAAMMFTGSTATEIRTTGTDCVVTLDDGFSSTAAVFTDGNRITVSDVDSFEMVIEVEGYTTYAGCTMKVTDIGIMSIQAGANEGQQINIDIPKVDVHTLDLDLINVNTGSGAADAIRKIDHAIFKVSSSRSELGAYQNRLERTTDSLNEYHENITTALSRIEDCDMAEEMTNFTAENVKTQAATSILAQANERPQTILQLLQ